MKRYIVASLLICSSAMAEQSLWQKFRSWITREKTDKDVEVRTVIKTPVEIAVVRMKDAASLCKAGLSIDSQLQKINEAAKERLLPLEEKVKQAMEKVTVDENRTEEMQAALYDTVRTERYQISEATDRAIEQLQRKLKEAIVAVAKKKHVVVFDSDAVLFGNEVSDITKDVIAELDVICPNIEVKIDSVKRY